MQAVTSFFITPAVVISAGSALLNISAGIADLKARQDMANKDMAELKTGQAELKAELKTGMAELKAELKTDMAELKAGMAELKTDIADISCVLAGVGLLGESVAGGLREAAGSKPLAAFVVATPAEVADWLGSIGLAQYAVQLAPLAGVNILLQTDASLKRLGVDLPDHRKKLMSEISRVAARGSAAQGGSAAR